MKRLQKKLNKLDPEDDDYEKKQHELEEKVNYIKVCNKKLNF